jgi:hypothetical protein
MMRLIRRKGGYYGFMELAVRQLLVLYPRKIIDFNQGRIVRLLAAKKGVSCQFLKIGHILPDDYKQVCVERADKICAGRIRVLNNEIDVSDGIDWGKDYLSGFVWPKGKYFREYVQVDLTNDADVKIPREISRFHFALALGLAYRYTEDEKYYLHFRKLILSWIEENPFMRSINWGCTQDVAIRAVNWIWAASLFQERIKKDISFYHAFSKSLYEHGVYVYLHPEKARINNHNHYLGDLVGQIYLGLVFQHDKFGREWLSWGIKELFREMRYQVLPTGPSYERSTNYHRLVTEMFLSAIIQIEKAGLEVPLDIRHRLEKMLEFIMYYSKPDGKAPVIGDQDDARIHPFSFEHNLEHRSLLSTAAILFNRADFKAASAGFNLDAMMLLGESAKQKYDEIPDIDLVLHSRSFPDAGFYIIRQKNDYMFINNGGKSKNAELGSGTHTHSDLLSFELYMDDKSFIVDPGSYIYSADPDARMLFRSTPMHNTVVVDGQNQNELKRDVLWNFERNAIPKAILWIDDEDKSIFEGEHNGYQRLKDPVTHRRRIEYDKNRRDWLIVDSLEGTGKHQIDVYFHFDAGIPIVYEAGMLRTVCKQGTNIELSFISAAKLEGIIMDGWVSKAYSKREKAKVFKLSCEAKCPLQIQTKIQRSL